MDVTQLFDLSKDPLELNNLATQPEYAAKVVELTAMLLDEMANYGDTLSLTVAHPRSSKWSPPTQDTAK